MLRASLTACRVLAAHINWESQCCQAVVSLCRIRERFTGWRPSWFLPGDAQRKQTSSALGLCCMRFWRLSNLYAVGWGQCSKFCSLCLSSKKMLICPVNVMHLSMQVMVIHFICKLLTSIAAICVTSTLAQAIGQLIYASVMACCDLCICTPKGHPLLHWILVKEHQIMSCCLWSSVKHTVMLHLTHLPCMCGVQGPNTLSPSDTPPHGSVSGWTPRKQTCCNWHHQSHCKQHAFQTGQTPEDLLMTLLCSVPSDFVCFNNNSFFCLVSEFRPDGMMWFLFIESWFDTGATVKRHQHLQTSGMKSSIWKFTNFMPTVAVPLATRSVPEATCMVKQGYVATKHSVKLCPLCVKVKM